jgi:hypothetical protein
MNSQPVINIIIGALVSGILVMINSWWLSWNNNKYQLEREELQRSWEIKREEQKYIWQERSDQQKWYQEKIYTSYTRTIQLLTNIIKVRINDPDLSSLDMIKLIIEFDSELNMIISGHPARHSNEFQEKILKIEDSFKTEPWVGRATLIEIMEKDSRIKTVNKNT